MRTSTADQAFVRFEQEGWDSIAHEYHRFLGPVTERAADALLDAAGVGPGDRLLDVATGPGYVAGRALDRGAAATGTDLSERILALAHRLRPGLELRVADAHDLPFPDGAFDEVVAGFLLPHLADHGRASASVPGVPRAGAGSQRPRPPRMRRRRPSAETGRPPFPRAAGDRPWTLDPRGSRR